MSIISIIISIVVGLALVFLIFERSAGTPLFFYKYSIRNFKISLFTKLTNKNNNKQLYVVTGVTWFNIPILYQKYKTNLTDSHNYENFTIGKINWEKNDCQGFENYEDAKKELTEVINKYIKKNKDGQWTNHLLNEDNL